MNKDQLESQETREWRVTLDPLDFLESLGNKDFVGQRENLGHRGTEDDRARRVREALRALLARWAREETSDDQGSRG